MRQNTNIEAKSAQWEVSQLLEMQKDELKNKMANKCSKLYIPECSTQRLTALASHLNNVYQRDRSQSWTIKGVLSEAGKQYENSEWGILCSLFSYLVEYIITCLLELSIWSPKRCKCKWRRSLQWIISALFHWLVLN